VDRIADFDAGDVDGDLVGDAVAVANELKLVAHDVEHAAALQARRTLFVDEDDWHRDFDSRVLADAEEVDVERTVGNGVESYVLRQRPHGLAVDLDHDDRVHEVAGAELASQFLGFDVDGQGFFLAAIDHGGDAAFATQCTGGSLASPFARLGRQGKRIAHISTFRCGTIVLPRHASRDDHDGKRAPLSIPARKSKACPSISAGA